MKSAHSTAHSGQGTSGDLERTAYHEAGHAVVAWALGVTVMRVTIDPAKVDMVEAEEARTKHGPRVRGQVTHGKSRLSSPLPLLMRRPWAISEAKKRLAIIRAGHYAELKAAGFAFEPEKLEVLAGIYDELKHQGRMQTYLEMAQKGATILAEKHARVLLNKNWHAVKALALALLERRTMSGAAVRKLLRETANGGTP